MKTRTSIIFASLALLLGLMSFQQLTREDLRAEKLQQRLNNYRTISEENCLERIYEDATAIVDSIIIERARAKIDTIDKPPRPDRPDKPEIILPSDTTPIAPLEITPLDTID